jgi:WD40-like Beta Propeller Repeat
MGPQGPYADFPKDPVIDTATPALPPNIGDLFGAPGTENPTGGPCLLEPEIGTLYPNNWLRPRFRVAAPNGENVFEIRIHSANETNDLVVYSNNPDWKMPKAMWQLVSTHLQDQPMTVTIRGAVLMGNALMGMPSLGTTGTITVAPAAANGSVVYWRTITATNSGELKGFSAGDETVTPVLATNQVQAKPGGAQVTCLGCHTSTPDGAYAAFKTLGATSGGALGSVQMASVGAEPTFWSMASLNAMNQASFGIPAFSKGHWANGDHMLLTSFGSGAQAELAWFDLEANASGQGVAYDFMTRMGDPNGAIMPAWSHDGKTVYYTSTNGSGDGRPTSSPTDVYSVPYANHAGGAATPVVGASDPNFSEYYPALSPDDKYLIFNRVAVNVNTYNEPTAEVFVSPTAGGTPTRVAANDPIACSSVVSPGITNSWPKWAPEAVTVGDRTFYWIIFSSRRGGTDPQLYMSAVVEQGGQLTTYPALYLWNQPGDEANHTPAWDVFQIPQIPPS